MRCFSFEEFRSFFALLRSANSSAQRCHKCDLWRAWPGKHVEHSNATGSVSHSARSRGIDY